MNNFPAFPSWQFKLMSLELGAMTFDAKITPGYGSKRSSVPHPGSLTFLVPIYEVKQLGAPTPSKRAPLTKGVFADYSTVTDLARLRG